MNNQITLIGHVGQTPVSKLFGDTGNKVIKFSIAVKDYSSNSEEDKTMWIDVDAWNGVGERVLDTVTKGREVVVQGKLALSTFSKDVNGVTVQMTKPVVKLTSSIYAVRSLTLNPQQQRETNQQRAGSSPQSESKSNEAGMKVSASFFCKAC